MKLKNIKMIALLCGFLGGTGVSLAGDSTLINGAGATFPYPLYSKWFDEYQKVEKDVRINYNSIGSGSGIKQFIDKTVDFGASDAPMTDEQLAKAKAPVIHIPTILGAVVVTYNLPGINSGLKLTPEILSEIFLGTISKWNDEKIKKLNPALKLPSDAIMVARRSDGSGTTAIFTDYLSKISPEWKKRVGAGTAVSWPVGLGGKGNEGVAGLVKQTPGSIGYVELIYAENNKLPYASLQNKAGHFIMPSTKSVSAAAKASAGNIPEDFRVSITNADGNDSYPISGFTYLLVWQQMGGEKGGKFVKFLSWAIHDGQRLAEPLFYAPLPKELVTKIDQKISSIKL